MRNANARYRIYSINDVIARVVTGMRRVRPELPGSVLKLELRSLV